MEPRNAREDGVVRDRHLQRCYVDGPLEALSRLPIALPYLRIQNLLVQDVDGF